LRKEEGRKWIRSGWGMKERKEGGMEGKCKGRNGGKRDFKRMGNGGRKERREEDKMMAGSQEGCTRKGGKKESRYGRRRFA
jgi:hypothetical protein